MAIIVADRDGDLTIEVVEYDENIVDENGEKTVGKTVEFLVSREVLINSSQYFTVLLCSSKYKEANKTLITLKDDKVASMDVLFRVLHGVQPNYDMNLDDTWHLAAACNKYAIDITKLYVWFANWYGKQPIDQWCEWSRKKELCSQVPNPRSLLYPCWIFDHAKGFLCITKFLAYHSTGHITEYNPTELYELHLPSRIIQQLNAAKGRLRTIIHNGLFAPNDKLLKGSCTCKEVTLFNYEKALYTINVWPLERVAQVTTMAIILERLNGFHFEPKKNACSGCRTDYQGTVKLAQSRTRGYFDGLCLDCLDKSKAKTGDQDSDYWRHSDLKEEEIVRGCRNNHGQPTWYFSFMGRHEARDRYLRIMRKLRYEGDSE